MTFHTHHPTPSIRRIFKATGGFLNTKPLDERLVKSTPKASPSGVLPKKSIEPKILLKRWIR